MVLLHTTASNLSIRLTIFSSKKVGTERNLHMAKDKDKNIFKPFKSYLVTEDLKKLWHFYLFLIIFNTWLELSLFALYRPSDINLNLLIAFSVGLVPIYAFSIYCIKYHAIEKKRPYWVLPFLAVLVYVFFTQNPNAIGFPAAPTLVRLYADNSLYLVFLTAIRIMFVVKRKS